MQTYIKKNLIPLTIVAVFSIFTFVIAFILLNKNQQTVALAEIPIHAGPSRNSKTVGMVTKGTKLKVIKTKNDWALVRQPNEEIAWLPVWLLNRKTPLKALTPLAETTVMLDAGHGGPDTGAISNTGQFEKTYTLKTAKLVRAALEPYGVHVVMTRTADHIVYLDKIPEIAEAHHADASISFHFDSSPVANSANGLTAYYYHQNNGSFALATAVNGQMHNLPVTSRGVEFGDFLVIRKNTLPAILLENGYINSDHDFKYIQEQSYREHIANDVRLGLEQYFKTH
ncbi:N-acetylmuramoyl-L-alanine amidase [Periweissella ghanensis]|uniref:SH3b domain-containing protein n=1 Tax=Periweissella ghanensis TaxID=467997 RepID=A0ABN8BLN0_9LACO|nr:N-acetylmuramoyl-L-alanine amidase [Periweissella ghanensis]MCM0600805.1 N-acetylmuramoyl-L-alanine amidase [Periweissella ghanensis]CAH0417779.1 hypothetical protein WGH24286_00192 [Periweissella ghanensis]